MSTGFAAAAAVLSVYGCQIDGEIPSLTLRSRCRLVASSPRTSQGTPRDREQYHLNRVLLTSETEASTHRTTLKHFAFPETETTRDATTTERSIPPFRTRRESDCAVAVCLRPPSRHIPCEIWEPKTNYAHMCGRECVLCVIVHGANCCCCCCCRLLSHRMLAAFA